MIQIIDYENEEINISLSIDKELDLMKKVKKEHEATVEREEDISLDFKDILQVISNIKNYYAEDRTSNTKDDIEQNTVNIYFLEKLYNTKDDNPDYNSYKPQLNNDIGCRLLDIVESKIESICNLKQIKYNPSGEINEELELCKKEHLGNSYDNLYNSLVFENNRLENGIDPENIHNYIVEFKSNNKSFRIYRRFTKLNKLRKGILGTITGGHMLERIKGPFLGIDNDIDLIEYNDIFIVLNHISLERIFDMQTEYIKQTEEALKIIKSKKIIKGFDSFRDDILENIPAMKRLTKSFEQKRLPIFFEKFSAVVKVSKHFKLGVSFTADNKQINYTDRSQLTEITLLMNDSYYKTLIGNHEGTDFKR